MIRVLSPGAFTTVQDLGRPGFCHLGVSAAGAADPVAFRLANRLVGNEEGAPALEMTLRGGRFAFDEACVVSLCGGDFEASIPMWRAVQLRAGDPLEIGVRRNGARCYLAIRGGVESDFVLGSASTHMLSGLGRVIQRGDTIGVGVRVAGDPCWRVISLVRSEGRIRVTCGASSAWFTGDAMMRFLSEPWTVSDQSNRQGIRLLGRRLTGSSELGQQMPSEGVALGAVQVPPSGEPVILFVDSQTTGGYPVIANVARVDVGVLGQLTPGSPVRFDALSFGDAQRLIVEQEQWIRACCV